MRLIQLSAIAAVFAPALISAVEEPSEVIRKRLGNVQYKSTNGVAEKGSRHLQDEECQGIVDIAVGNPDFSTLVAAVTAAGLVDALSGDGPLTVFAPTNDAFAALPEGTVESLLLPENIDTLTNILTYHVVAAEVPSTALENGDVETLSGASVTVNLDDGVKINDSNVITPDIQACNGIIHVIDAVLLPPPPEPETLPEEEMSMSMPECQGIVDIAVGNPDFSTLVAAVTAAGLVDALSGDGPLTVFAPTNDAFAALPEGTVESLLLPENLQQLTDILTYHVVAAEVPSTALENGDVETLNGASVTVNLDDGVKINDSNVIIPDIMACNGIIHVIDAVLLPPMDMAPEEGGDGGDDPVASAKAEKEPGMMGGKSGKSKSSKAKTLKETPMAKTTKVEKAEEAMIDAKAEKISKSTKAKSSKAKSGKSEEVASEKASSKAEKMAPTRQLLLRN